MRKRASTERPGLFRRLSARGQAMVEYSVITHFLLIGGTVLLLPVITKLYESLSLYFESIYFVLNTAAI
ncbi:MAG: hypothetical protein IT380_12265 [Myxococcales bacterium]|nr:hypothetical protein [Myxococcales bacterium]